MANRGLFLIWYRSLRRYNLRGEVSGLKGFSWGAYPKSFRNFEG